MIGNLLFGLAALVAIAAMLDWLVSDKQKAAISAWTLRAWNWLDDARKFSPIKWLRSRQGTFVILGLGIFMGIVPALLGLGVMIWKQPAIFQKAWSFLVPLYLLQGVPPLLAPFVIRWAISPDRARWQRVGLWSITMLAVLIFLSLTVMSSLGIGFAFAFPGTSPLGIAVFLVSMIFTYVWLYMVIAFLPFMSACTLSGGLFAFEFLFRRIAEYPKGPILALSALCAGIAGIVKLWT